MLDQLTHAELALERLLHQGACCGLCSTLFKCRALRKGNGLDKVCMPPFSNKSSIAHKYFSRANYAATIIVYSSAVKGKHANR